MSKFWSIIDSARPTISKCVVIFYSKLKEYKHIAMYAHACIHTVHTFTPFALYPVCLSGLPSPPAASIHPAK